MNNSYESIKEELNNKLKDLYNDFSRRREADEWERFINETGDDDIALRAILEFTMENYYISHEVWMYLDERFRLLEKADELKKQYPADFIEYVVINGIKYASQLPQEMFEPGVDGGQCDLYRSIYSKAMTVGFEELPVFIEHLDGLSEYHPYGEALKFYYDFNMTMSQDSLNSLKKIYEKYPESLKIASDYAFCLIRHNSLDEALMILEALKEKYPKNYDVRYLVVRCFNEMNDYYNATEELKRMIEIFGPNDELDRLMNDDVYALIESKENYAKIAPEDMENMLDLAESYYRVDHRLKAEEILNRIADDEVDYKRYCNLKGKILMDHNEYEKALDYFYKAYDCANQNKDRNEKVTKELAYIDVYIAECLMVLNDQQRALTYFDEAKDLEPENYLIQVLVADSFKENRHYLEAIDVYEAMCQKFTGQIEAHYKLALLYEVMNEDQNAINHINEVLAENEDDAFMHYLKLKILLRHRMYVDVKDYLVHLEERKLDNEIPIQVIKALMKEYDENKPEEAMEILKEVIDVCEGDYEFIDLPYVYCHLAELISDDYEHFNDNKQKMHNLIDEGLKIDPENLRCISVKSWLLNREDRYEESLEYLNRALKDSRHGLDMEERTANTLFLGFNNRYKEALDYYNMLPYREHDEVILIRMIYSLRCLGEYDKAKNLNKILLENFPDYLKGYSYMAVALMIEYKYEEAMTYLDKGIALIKEDSYAPFVTELYNEKIKLLRRMAKPIEAMDTADELLKVRSKEYVLKRKADIALQYGLFDDAKKILDEYKKNKDAGYFRSQYSYYLNTRQFDKAEKYLEKCKKDFSEYDYSNNHCFLDYMHFEYEDRVNRFLKMSEKDPDNVYFLGNIADSYYKLNDFDKVKEYATKSLEVIERKLENDHESEMLYHSKRIPLYAMLKEDEKLEEELEIIKTLPMCTHCAYKGCKDLAIYEIDVAILKGDYKKALELCLKYQKIYPDEMDFVAQELEVLKEMKK